MKNKSDHSLRSLKRSYSMLFPWGLVLVLVFIVQTLMLPGCARFKEWKYLPATKAEERTIHVISRGRHTGIVLSRQDVATRFGFLDGYLRQSPYYEFGWGEAVFYQSETNTVGMALKALFWINDSVMHVAALPETPEKQFNRNDVVRLNISETGLDYLEKGLLASFRLDPDNNPYPLGKGLYGESRFFKAEGYYLFTNTCNRWTASMLNKAGVPMDTVFTLFARSVISQAEEAGQRYNCCGGTPSR